MSELVCNYAIARFRPYRETSEFVNVGVVLICQQVNYFGFLFERRRPLIPNQGGKPVGGAPSEGYARGGPTPRPSV